MINAKNAKFLRRAVRGMVAAGLVQPGRAYQRIKVPLSRPLSRRRFVALNAKGEPEVKYATHEWQTRLVPGFARSKYRELKKVYAHG